MTLTRTHTDLANLVDGRHPVRTWAHDDHPPLPSDRALARLRTRVQSTWAKDHEPTVWWHRAGEAWAAVTDLHRNRCHDDAMALALLLAWCDSFSWEEASLWTFSANPSRPAVASRDSGSKLNDQLDLLAVTP